MTWTKEDTEALRDMEPCGGFVGCHPDGQSYVDANALLERAAAHIEALEARVAELERTSTTLFLAEAWNHAARDAHVETMLQASARITALEAERAEVVKELWELSEPTGTRTHDALMTLREEVRALAYRLERKGEP